MNSLSTGMDLSEVGRVNERHTCDLITDLLNSYSPQDEKSDDETRPEPPRPDSKEWHHENYPVMRIIHTLNGDGPYKKPPKAAHVHMKKIQLRSGTPNREPYVNLVIEQHLETWVTEMQKRCFRITKRTLVRTTKELVSQHKLEAFFPSDEVRKCWLRKFFKTHRQLLNWKPDLESWCTQVRTYLDTIKQTTILDEPMRIFYLDQMYFYFDSKSGKCCQDISHEPIVNRDKTIKTITVATFYSATGAILPSVIVYPIDKLSLIVEKTFPKNWYHCVSETGLLTSRNFLNYIKKINAKLQAWRIKTPIMLFMDGKHVDVGYDVLKYCNLNLILFYNVRSDNRHIFHLSHIILPILRGAWTKINSSNSVRKDPTNTKNFANCISVCFSATFNSNIIRKIFRECGIFPFKCNPNGSPSIVSEEKYKLDKYIPNASESSESSESETESTTEMKTRNIEIMENNISPFLLKQFKQTRLKRSEWVGDFEATFLYRFWCILHGDDMKIE